jgi:enoyl-CoA hydratase
MAGNSPVHPVTVDRRGKVVTVTINNPPINEITDAMEAELLDAFLLLNRDPDINVLVLTAGGDRVFCAGGSFDEMIERSRQREWSGWVRAVSRSRRILMSMLDFDAPIIARVQGHAIGLGATLALYSDIVIAVDTAKFADPHVQVGLAAGDGGAAIWPQLVGYGRAKYYLFTGERIAAPEAAAMGLIHRAVPREELDGVVYELAERLAGLSRSAVCNTKRAINIPLLRELVSSFDAHMGLETCSALSPDHLEAVLALKEKRPPKFNPG